VFDQALEEIEIKGGELSRPSLSERLSNHVASLATILERSLNGSLAALSMVGDLLRVERVSHSVPLALLVWWDVSVRH